MSPLGAFSFVLHTHLPYVRLAGRWPHGEEWIHEAATETYIPLLQTLLDLRDEGLPFSLVISISPVLAEQLADPDVLEHLEQYIEQRIEAAKCDVVHFQTNEPNQQMVELAGWYLSWFQSVRDVFKHRLGGDIIGAFRDLAATAHVDLITSAATHAYLPLLSRDSSIDVQIKQALQTHERLFGQRPRAMWLPECAYRPAYLNQDGSERPGLETFLARYGISLFFAETHTITGGQPVGVAAGEVIGAYGYIKRRYVVPANPTLVTPERPATTYRPYYVSDTIAGITAAKHSGVVVVGRNNQTGTQVWSAQWGYPGDFDYREFHKRAGTSGLQYWRVTGAGVELGEKDFYHPDWAASKIEQHAEHFAHLVGDSLREHHQQTGDYGLISSNYDTELFGHWWFEGVRWLGRVLRHLAHHPDVELTTVPRFVSEHPPSATLHIPEGSWGSNGTHFTWDNAETHWMWEPIHETELRMEELARRYENATPPEETVLTQAAREVLLLQSSDWPFLITTGQAREYAIQRFSQHLTRFNRLVESLGSQPDVEYAAECWELDRVFPDLDYHWFAYTEELQ